MLLKITSFPCSGLDYLEDLIRAFYSKPEIYRLGPECDPFGRLEDWCGEDNCIIKTYQQKDVDARLTKPDNPKNRKLTITVIRHPSPTIKAFANFLYNYAKWDTKKDVLDHALNPYLVCSKNWKDFYSNHKQKTDLLIHYEDLIKRPAGNLRVIEKEVPKLLGQRSKKIFFPEVKKRHKAEYRLKELGTFPLWYDRAIEDQCRVIYEEMGFEWTPEIKIS